MKEETQDRDINLSTEPGQLHAAPTRRDAGLVGGAGGVFVSLQRGESLAQPGNGRAGAGTDGCTDAARSTEGG